MDLENLLITERFKQKGKIAVTLFHSTHAVPDLVLVSVFALFGGGIQSLMGCLLLELFSFVKKKLPCSKVCGQ